jgi:hypothetical protein
MAENVRTAPTGTDVPSAVTTCRTPHRISSGAAARALGSNGFPPAQRIPLRSALFASAAAGRLPLAIANPDSSPVIAYYQLPKQLTGVSPR